LDYTRGLFSLNGEAINPTATTENAAASTRPAAAPRRRPRNWRKAACPTSSPSAAIRRASLATRKSCCKAVTASAPFCPSINSCGQRIWNWRRILRVNPTATTAPSNTHSPADAGGRDGRGRRRGCRGCDRCGALRAGRARLPR